MDPSPIMDDYYVDEADLEGSLDLLVLARLEPEARFYQVHTNLNGLNPDPHFSERLYNFVQSEQMAVWIVGLGTSGEELPVAIGIAGRTAHSGAAPVLLVGPEEVRPPQMSEAGLRPVTPGMFTTILSGLFPNGCGAQTSGIQGVFRAWPGQDLSASVLEPAALVIASSWPTEVFRPTAEQVSAVIPVVPFRDQTAREIEERITELRTAGYPLIGMVTVDASNMVQNFIPAVKVQKENDHLMADTDAIAEMTDAAAPVINVSDGGAMDGDAMGKEKIQAENPAVPDGEPVVPEASDSAIAPEVSAPPEPDAEPEAAADQEMPAEPEAAIESDAVVESVTAVDPETPVAEDPTLIQESQTVDPSPEKVLPEVETAAEQAPDMTEMLDSSDPVESTEPDESIPLADAEPAPDVIPEPIAGPEADKTPEPATAQAVEATEPAAPPNGTDDSADDADDAGELSISEIIESGKLAESGEPVEIGDYPAVDAAATAANLDLEAVSEVGDSTIADQKTGTPGEVRGSGGRMAKKAAAQKSSRPALWLIVALVVVVIAAAAITWRVQTYMGVEEPETIAEIEARQATAAAVRQQVPPAASATGTDVGAESATEPAIETPSPIVDTAPAANATASGTNVTGAAATATQTSAPATSGGATSPPATRTAPPAVAAGEGVIVDFKADTGGPYAVLCGSFGSLQNAKREVARLLEMGEEARVVSLRIPEKGVFHRVIIGRESDRVLSEELARKVLNLDLTDTAMIVAADGCGIASKLPPTP